MTARRIGTIIAVVGVGLQVATVAYLGMGVGRTAMSALTYLAWASLPYVLCLLYTRYGDAMPGACGAAAVLATDLFFHVRILVIGAGALETLNTLPMWYMFISLPVGAGVGMAIKEWRDRGKGEEKGDNADRET